MKQEILRGGLPEAKGKHMRVSRDVDHSPKELKKQLTRLSQK